MSLRNIVCTLVFCLSISGPIMLFIGQNRIGLDLPAWLTNEDAIYLAGVKNNPDIAGMLSPASFVDGTLQSGVESEVGNYVPCKAWAQLANAKIQRTAIALSNEMFDWDAYPTFYGSKYAYVPKDDVLLGLSGKATRSEIQRIEEAKNAYNEFAERHPSLDFAMYCVMSSDYLTDSPISDYKTHPMNYAVFSASFLDQLKNYKVISGHIDYEEYKDGWFSTDHHWNIDGAYEAYVQIVSSLDWGKGDIVLKGDKLVASHNLFRGSLSRSSLYDREKGDVFFDYQFDTPQYSLVIDNAPGGSTQLSNTSSLLDGERDLNDYANQYTSRYHPNWGELIINNDDNLERDGALLLVADSYSNCMERLLAAHFPKTYVYDARYNHYTLDEYIEKHPDIVHVLFLSNPGSLLRDASLEALGE